MNRSSVTCLECGRDFQVLNNHLHTHGLDAYSYKQKYPNSLLEALELTEKRSRALSIGVTRSYLENPHLLEIRRQTLLRNRQQTDFMAKNVAGRLFAYRENPEYKRNLSLAQKALWSDPDYAKMVLEAQRRKPNKVETFLRDWLEEKFPGEWEYTGDGEVWIGGRNPDFTNVNSRKVVVEIFGTRFHTDPEGEEKKVEHYRQYGFKCIVIWADNPEDIIAEWPNIVRRLKEA